ncbi:hypothetical protein [Pseudomonas caricapapayae]|uniref:hypothetical protein n=1 Tax=Pseudomonas caricapapayae TaxID=46678 RepID=UPI0006D6040D|nr:hypothetical protein [Pseudomonas caricapapayae]KAA8692043.1 hypothetical protein F4W67_23650 [Pseudomonas caricapapayae]
MTIDLLAQRVFELLTGENQDGICRYQKGSDQYWSHDELSEIASRLRSDGCEVDALMLKRVSEEFYAGNHLLARYVLQMSKEAG